MINLHDKQSGSPQKGKKTLVFFHGSSFSAGIWDYQLKSELFKDYHLMAIDLPGHGDSPRFDDYSVKSILQNLHDHIKDLDDVVLVGHSIGGNFAIELLNSLQNVSGLVLAGTCPLKRPINMAEAYLPSPALAITFNKFLDTHELEQILDINCHKDSMSKYNFIENMRITDPVFRERTAQAIGSNEFQNHVEILQNCSIPIAILYSEDEEIINLKYLESLELNTLWQTIQVIPKSKHCPQVENPDRFNAVLASFLKDLA